MDKGLITLDVEYIDGTKIESKANKYTYVWRKTVEKNKARLISKVEALLDQIDDCIAQEQKKEKSEGHEGESFRDYLGVSPGDLHRPQAVTLLDQEP